MTKPVNKVKVLKHPIVLKPAKYKHLQKNEAMKALGRDYWQQYAIRVKALLEEGYPIEALGVLIALSAPGFQVKVSKKRKGGRPARWNAEQLANLWYAVRLVMERDNCTDEVACITVFQTGLYQNQNIDRPTTLLRRFHQAKGSSIVKKAAPALEAYGFGRFFRELGRAAVT